MHKGTKLSIAILRVCMGALFLYAGVSKIINPDWSAAGFLNNAQTFPEFYAWFASSSNLVWVNLLNEWGLTLIGVALIFGAFTRWAALVGIVLMILYYFPSLNFPHAGEHAYIIDDHIIYAVVLWVLIKTKAGHFWGWDGRRGY